jgi:hypothetical protein
MRRKCERKSESGKKSRKDEDEVIGLIKDVIILTR